MEKLILMDISFRRSILFRKHFIKMLSLVTALLFPWHSATAAPGDLDRSFGNGGSVTTPLQFTNVLATELQQDGKILVLTQDDRENTFLTLEFYGNNIARYLPNGRLDSTFGNGGIVTVASSPTSQDYDFGYMSINHMALKKNGKIMLFGFREGGQTMILQLKSNGQIDTTFGGGKGYVVHSLDIMRGDKHIALQQDEKIIMVINNAKGGNPIEGEERELIPYAPDVMRLHPDGSIDTSFGGGDGIVEIPAEDHIYIDAISIDRASDKITVGGIDGTFEASEETITPLGQLKFIRLTKNGDLDRTFNNDGIVTLGDHNSNEVTAMTVTPTGKLLIAAYKSLVRFNSNGSLDNRFNYRPGTQPPLSSLSIKNIQLQAGGKLLLSGNYPQDITARYHWSGALDNHFGGGDGYINLAGFFERLALQPNGKIVAVSDLNDSIVLQRFLNDLTDLTPNAMRFANRSRVTPQSMITSNSITVTGITADTYVPVNIRGGSYSVNNRAFTNKPGWVKKGDVIRIKHKASSRSNATTKSTLTVGGLQSQTNMALVLGQRNTASFSSKTRP